MNNKKRKQKILLSIESGSFQNVYEAMKTVGGDVGALEAIPFGLRNEVVRIAEDLADGSISQDESVTRLAAFVQSVPDEA